MGDIYHKGDTYAGSVPIDDTQTTAINTWSAQKINNEIAVLNELGAKNLLPNTATTQTVSGVTFTVNSDGTVTVNGTSTALIRFTLAIGDIGLESGKQYIFSGLPEDSNSKYLQYVYGDGTTPSVNITSINGGIITPSNHSGQSFDIIISANQTLSNYTFKPMLRLASDPDDTYQPYAMTNRELTKAASNVQGAINKLNDVTLVGDIVIVASWAQVQTALTTKVASMKNNTIENMILACSAAFTQMPYGGYFATQVSKTNNNLWSALLHGYSGETKHISYNSGTWKYVELESASTLTVTSGTSNYTLTASYAYRQGNHIHAEVYGTYGATVTTGTQVPFFTISGIQAPSALKTVGTVIIMDSSAKPTLIVPALAKLGTNKYVYQYASTSLSSGYRLGFIVDFCDV